MYSYVELQLDAHVVLVSSCDLRLEDVLVEVATALVHLLLVAVLLHQRQQTARIEEGSQPISRHLLLALRE